MTKIFLFVGASGVGKSTLIDYLNLNFAVKALEISARPYLPPGGSYDQTLTAESQAVIVHSRTVALLEECLNQNEQLSRGMKVTPAIFSRSSVDNLAYQRVLNKAAFFDTLVKREVEIVKKYCSFLYIPIEFPMTDNGDTIRGLNSEIRDKTDQEIQNIFQEFNITPIIIKGTKEQRFEKLNKIFNTYKIK